MIWLTWRQFRAQAIAAAAATPPQPLIYRTASVPGQHAVDRAVL